jgi:hypothetical protein
MITQSEAMQRFLGKMKPLLLGKLTAQYKSYDEVVEDGFSFLEPFVANPQRHKEAIKMIMGGMGAQLILLELEDDSLWLRRSLGKTGFSLLGKIGFIRPNLEMLRRVETVRDELLESVHPGEFGIDILPPREKDDAVQHAKLVVFQVNVAVYPLPDFTPQSLSVRLTALNEEIQFEDVNPATRIDAVGSYEIGVTESGKFTETNKDTESLAFKLDGQVAKLESQTGNETSRSMERSSQLAMKRSASTHAPLVISSALRNVARWELLRAPNQTLMGGSRFLATAFVPVETTMVTLDVRMRVDLEKYGPHEISLVKEVELSSKPSSLLVPS